jgi:hypothetical protein
MAVPLNAPPTRQSPGQAQVEGRRPQSLGAPEELQKTPHSTERVLGFSESLRHTHGRCSPWEKHQKVQCH